MIAMSMNCSSISPATSCLRTRLAHCNAANRSQLTRNRAADATAIYPLSIASDMCSKRHEMERRRNRDGRRL